MSRKPPDTWAIFRFTVGRIRHYRNKDYYIWAIVYDGKMRGFIELLPVKSVRKIYSFSYKLDMSLKNMGIMTEAVKAVIEYMKTQDVYGLSATCDVENIGSKRVMQKAGMKKRELSPENQTIKYEDGTEGKRAYYRIKLQ
ncbi:MAG: GNAT family N-acetyltransferase [Clostridiales bacterium]|nr:GNAT family N-acetyltransferase [Clostridiales bacterium]